MNSNIIIQYALYIPAILIAVTIHEFTKAAVSTSLGDSAPKTDKRLSLNPFRHFEPIGFIFLIFFGFGWGKPVRTSGVYYKNRTVGTVLTYSMPIVANILFSFIFAICNALWSVLMYNSGISEEVYIFTKLFFNCLIRFNLSLALFNIIPVAPLCGNKIMTAFMSPNEALKVSHYEKILQLALIMLLMFGVVSMILDPLINQIITFYNFIVMLIF